MKIQARRIKCLATVVDAVLSEHDNAKVVESSPDYGIEITLTAEECRQLVDVFAASIGHRSFMGILLVKNSRKSLGARNEMFELLQGLHAEARAISKMGVKP